LWQEPAVLSKAVSARRDFARSQKSVAVTDRVTLALVPMALLAMIVATWSQFLAATNHAAVSSSAGSVVTVHSVPFCGIE